MTEFDAERPVPADPPQVGDDVPEADALEQQRTARPDDDVDESPIEPAVEADAADVEEQRRAVPIEDDDRG